PSPIPARSPVRTPTPRPTPTASPTPVVAPTPSPIPLQIPTPAVTLTSTPTPALGRSPASAKSSRFEEIAEGSTPESLVLSSPVPSLRNALEEEPLPKPSGAPPSPTTGPQAAKSKDQMIAQFKKQTESVLVQVRDATGNFREIGRFDAVQALPASVKASVASLADQARDFRAQLGYQVTFYECGAETATVEALTTLDGMTRALTEKNAPGGRQQLIAFFRRYPAPTLDNQKPLWRYLGSVLLACEKAKKEAEGHLDRAQSLGAAGKKSEALREYQEIYRIYPNPITADRIKLLQEQAH